MHPLNWEEFLKTCTCMLTLVVFAGCASIEFTHRKGVKLDTSRTGKISQRAKQNEVDLKSPCIGHGAERLIISQNLLDLAFGKTTVSYWCSLYDHKSVGQTQP